MHKKHSKLILQHSIRISKRYLRFCIVKSSLFKKQESLLHQLLQIWTYNLHLRLRHKQQVGRAYSVLRVVVQAVVDQERVLRGKVVKNSHKCRSQMVDSETWILVG